MRRKKLVPLIFIILVAAVSLGAVLFTDTSPQLGLDLQGGVSVVLEPTQEASDDALAQTIEIIRSRVDALGVAEPEITRQGRSVVVQLPGVKNQNRALEVVGATAELRFRPVLQVLGDYDALVAASRSTTTTGDPSTTAAADGSTTTDGATTTTTVAGEQEEFALTPRSEDLPDATVRLAEEDAEQQPTTVYQLGPSQATGKVVKTASARLGNDGTWSVSLEMRGGERGIDLFNAIAAQCSPPSDTCPTGQLAIVLDSVVQSAPTIRNASFSASDIEISGDFTESEAKDLALVLRYGSLPVTLEPQTVQTVSATLGEDSLRAGLVAGFAGLALVCLYMVFYYRALGIVVVLGLCVWASLLYAIISYLGVALSLAGVTGIVVSIGVTVDSYVVYFERLKDELRAGRTLRSSTERAFSRAFRTILAADISSFIGAFLLFTLTVGPVRGFAFFLGLSTILDVVVAWFFTRPVVGLLATYPTFTNSPVLGVARGLNVAKPAATPAGAGR